MLANCIACITEKGRAHIPYRDSKLTHLLQDSLGGNCLTTIVATISPSECAVDETMSTLKFATRASNVKNVATTNIVEDPRRQIEAKVGRIVSSLGGWSLGIGHIGPSLMRLTVPVRGRQTFAQLSFG